MAERTRQYKALLMGWLIAAVLDAAAAMIIYIMNVPGGNPLKVWRFVASAVLGPDSLNNNLETMAVTGLIFHFFIAICFALFFLVIFRRMKWMWRNLAVTGLVYGLFIWTVMNLVVLPLSRIPSKAKLWTVINGKLSWQFPADPKQLIIGILVILFCVGLPISLIIGGHLRKRQMQSGDLRREA